jgi:hypothetical protein
MSNPTALDGTHRTTPPSGRLTVGDYVGAPAGEAAEAVRRAGLKPGLDRQVGYPAESVGRVVAQEPPAGETQQRGGIVTLYVAAPGPLAAGGQALSQEPAAERGSSVAAGSGECEQAQSPGPPARGVRERSAATVSYMTAGGLPPSQTPLRSPRRSRPAARSAAHEPDSAARVEIPVGVASVDCDAGREPTLEQLTASMRDAFAAPERHRGRRRIYPREPIGLRVLGAWAKLRRFRLRVFVCVALACWLAFALGHRGAHPLPAAGGRVQAPRASALPVTKALPVAPPRRSTHRANRHHEVHRPRSRSARTEAQFSAPSPVSREPARVQGVEADTPPATPSGGGPFSP